LPPLVVVIRSCLAFMRRQRGPVPCHAGVHRDDEALPAGFAETATEDVRRRTLTGRLMRAEIIGKPGLYRTLPIRQPS